MKVKIVLRFSTCVKGGTVTLLAEIRGKASLHGKEVKWKELGLATSKLICWTDRPICEFNVRTGARFESHQCASQDRRRNRPSSRLRIESQGMPRFSN